MANVDGDAIKTEAAFRRRVYHSIKPGEPDQIGPNLHGLLIGRRAIGRVAR